MATRPGTAGPTFPRSRLRDQYALSSDPAEQKRIAAELQRVAIDEGLYVPLGQSTPLRAYSSKLSGLPLAPAPVFWGRQDPERRAATVSRTRLPPARRPIPFFLTGGSMRWLLAMIKHETNTFSPVPTPLERFFRGSAEPVSGDAAVALYGGTNSGLAGYLDVARETGADVTIPVAAAAWPSGPATAETYRALCQPVLDELSAATTRCCWTCTEPW